MAWRLIAVVGLVSAAACAAAGEGSADGAPAPRLLLTTDTGGIFGACRFCPKSEPYGGLARRATVLRQLRSGRAVLTLDAGNSLFGGEGVSGGPAAVVDAFNRMRYDAVNVSYRDFRLGVDATRLALAKAKVILQRAGRKIAIVGVTARPAALDALPHLRRQLRGVRIAPAAEALRQIIPQARADADAVVLLYYGSPRSLERDIRAVRDRIDLIFVGQARADALAPASAPVVIAAREAGAEVLAIPLSPAPPGQPTRIRITAKIKPDPEVAAVLAKRIGKKD